MRRLFGLLLASLIALAFATAAAAHHLTVTPKGQGQGTAHWVGGPVPLPAQAQGQGLFAGLFGALPAAHGTGLVQACLSNTSGVAVFLPPGPPGVPDTDCQHGEP